MKHLGTDYYVGLLSAADHWGAAHHKPQILQVMTAKRHHLKRLHKLGMRFLFKKDFSEIGVVSAKASFGFFKISSPELTALDVVSYRSASGGFNNVCLVVRDLIDEMKEKLLMACCKKYGIMSSVQRLGYMMEQYGASKELIDPLREWVRKQRPLPIPLITPQKRKGPIHKDWQIIENGEVEFEE
jgi:predicted transcriptional regulator of viral defense system